MDNMIKETGWHGWKQEQFTKRSNNVIELTSMVNKMVSMAHYYHWMMILPFGPTNKFAFCIGLSVF